MPIIKSAKKKQRQDKKRTAVNAAYRSRYKSNIKKLKKSPVKSTEVKEVYASIDKAVKKGILHKNKAARLKSQAAKFAKHGEKVPN